MRTEKIRIFSKGTGHDTSVYILSEDGFEDRLKNVRAVDLRIRPDEVVTANLQLFLTPLEVVVQEAKLYDQLDRLKEVMETEFSESVSVKHLRYIILGVKE